MSNQWLKQKGVSMKVGNLVAGVSGMILRVILVIAAVFLIYKGALTCYDYGYRIYTEPAYKPNSQETKTVVITKDMSPKEIGVMLKNKGLIGDEKLFALQYYLSEYREDVKPGVFELGPYMTAEDMMAVMTVDAEEESEENDN